MMRLREMSAGRPHHLPPPALDPRSGSAQDVARAGCRESPATHPENRACQRQAGTLGSAPLAAPGDLTPQRCPPGLHSPARSPAAPIVARPRHQGPAWAQRAAAAAEKSGCWAASPLGRWLAAPARPGQQTAPARSAGHMAALAASWRLETTTAHVRSGPRTAERHPPSRPSDGAGPAPAGGSRGGGRASAPICRPSRAGRWPGESAPPPGRSDRDRGPPFSALRRDRAGSSPPRRQAPRRHRAGH